MTLPRASVLVVVPWLSLGCGGGGSEGGADDLRALARTGEYRSWPAEAGAHPSLGPHGARVRTFVNPQLRESLETGGSTHPAGSTVVKELFGTETGTETDANPGKVIGFAINRKRSDGTWVFFEANEPSLEGFFFVGTANLCGNCHQAGVDFVLTPASALR